MFFQLACLLKTLFNDHTSEIRKSIFQKALAKDTPIHSSTVRNGPKAEATRVPSDGCGNARWSVCIVGYYSALKRKATRTPAPTRMNPESVLPSENQPDTEGQMLYKYSTSTRLLEESDSWTQTGARCCKGLAGRGTGSWHLLGTQFQSGRMEVLETDGDDVAQQFKTHTFGAPGWLSRLSIRLQLRS